MGFKLYIKPSTTSDVHIWWKNFTNNFRLVSNRMSSVRIRGIEHELQQSNAVLKLDTEQSVSYLLFENKEDAAMFVLKWS